MTSLSDQSRSIETWPLPSPSQSAEHSRLPLLIAILAVLTMARLIGLRFSVVDLFFDEAQYWWWGHDLAFGYFSKPPFLAWTIAAARQVCGDAEWCVRAPAPLFYFITSLTVYFVTRRLYDETTGFWAGLLMALTTGVVFSTRVISTDVPLLFFWSLALLAYVHLATVPQKRWVAVLGISIGLGLLSKYAMIYFIPGALLAAFLSERARNVLKGPHFWAGLFIAVLVILPNIIWNYAHSFMTFKHTGGLVLGEQFQLSFIRVLEFFGAQFGVFGPVVFAVMIIAAFKLRSPEIVEQDRVMIAFYIFPVTLILIIAIGAHAYANWAATSIVSGVILTAALLVRQKKMIWLWISIALGLAMQITLLFTDPIAPKIKVPFLKAPNPYNRTLAWRAYGERVGQLAEEIGAPTIANDFRGQVSALRYYWRDKPAKILSWGTTDSPNFDVVHPLTQSAKEPILFVTSCPDEKRVKEFYTDVQPLGQYQVTVGTTTRPFYAFRLAQSRGPIGILEQCKY
jgi:4-amino-4-deoxy-L-arabinose transferase-like glycosyltransferase